MLRVERIKVSYDEVPALHEVSFKVEPGQIVSIVGANGAGKSTILKSISSVLRLDEGSISFEDQRIDKVPPHQVVDMGIAHVPEGRRLFARLTVNQNLTLGAYTRKSPEHRQATLKSIFQLFPVLEERQQQRAGTLSGGEQQMLAIARSLMSQPKLLMLDEPSMGLAILVKEAIADTVKSIKEEGVTILLVEQDAGLAFDMADRVYVLEQGKIALQGLPEKLMKDPYIKEIYLGLA